MQVYVFKSFRRVLRVLAGEYRGYLTWPGTDIPFLDRMALATHPEKARIEAAVDAALSDEVPRADLWRDAALLSVTLKVADSVQ